MLEFVDNYCSGIITIFQMMFFVRIILDRKNIIKNKVFLLFIVFILSVVYSFVFIKLQGTTKSLTLAIIYVFLCKFLYNLSFVKSIFITFIYLVVVLLTDLLVLFCLINVFNMSKDFCYNVFAGSFFGALANFVVFILIIYLLRKIFKKIIETKVDNDKKIIVLSILTFICVVLFFYGLIEKFRFTNDVKMYFLCIIILLLILGNLIKQVIDNKKLSDKYDKLLEFMTTYENEIENQRILRHETKNEFLVIKAKLCDKQNDKEIVDYIDVILKDKIIVNNEKYAQFGYLPPKGIKGLCYLKIQEAENVGLEVSINVSKKVSKFKVEKLSLSQQRDLARILGVLLDNAREASLESSLKKIGLEVYVNNKGGLKIIISNTFDNDVDINMISKKKFSTKGKNRGHGLMLVDYILKNNKIFKLETNIVKDIYVQILTIIFE